MKLRELGTIITGNTPSRNNKEFYNSNDIPFFKPSDFIENVINELNLSEEYISENARSSARILPKNTVLMTCIGTIGKVGVLKQESACNQQINAIITNDKVIPEYLCYLLLSKKKYFQKKANAPVVPIINKTDFSNIEVYTHNIDEQKRIVKQISKIDKLINNRKNEIEKLNELIKSKFVEMFANDSYSNYKWNDVFNTTTGKLDSNAMVSNGKYPFFTCAKESFWIDEYAFDCEALMLAGNNAAGIYDVKHYKGKFNAYQRTYVLTLKNNNWKYEIFKLQLEDKLELLRHQSKGSNTRYLTMKILNDLTFKIPPVSEQEKFTKIVKQIDKQKLECEKSLKKLEELQSALMQEYFG